MNTEKEIQEYIEGTQALLTKSAAVYEKHAPTIADKLIALGLVKASSKQAAVRSLHSPELVLKTLDSLLDSSLASRAPQPVSSLGSPVKLANTKVPEKGEKESELIWKRQFLTQ